MSERFFVRGKGVAPAKIDIRDYKGKVRDVACSARLPEKYELATVPVKDQGIVGSCVAHAISSLIEYFEQKESKKYTRLSTDYIYGNRRGSMWKSTGMRVRDAMKNVCEYGDVEYRVMSGNHEVPVAISEFENNVLRYYPVPAKEKCPKRYFRLQSANAIKLCLMSYGPVVFCMDWRDDNAVKNGVLKIGKKKVSGSHCMLIYGWNKDGWLIQNSWGRTWGESGRAVLPYDVKFEAWGVEDQKNKDATLKVVEPYKSQIGKTFAKVVNDVANFLLKR